MATTKGKLYDHRAPVEERIADTIARMTLEEKVSQMMFRASAVKRLGIPEYNWWSEALHGVARAGRATVFPQAIGLAASFDRALVKRLAGAISDEGRAKHHAAAAAGNRGQCRGLTFWSPNVNIFRDPRWGRGQETWGEDPFLTGTLGTAFVKGMQGTHPRYLKTAACAKHFAVHSGPEKARHYFDAQVNRRDLYETYLRAFGMLVNAGVESVMGAYNRTNGEACCASPTLLRQVLRERWKFDGHVVSDCWALNDIYQGHHLAQTPAQAAALALTQGCDLECGSAFAHLPEALAQGLITEDDIDRALARLLRTRIRLGMFDPPKAVPFASIPQRVINCDKHRRLAREAAAKSIVLLKNTGGVLPLKSSLKSIFVTGPAAASIDVLLGNYYGQSSTMVTVLEGITASCGEGTTVEYKIGAMFDRPNDNPIDWTTGNARDSDVTVAVMGISPLMEGEEGDAIASASLGDRDDIGLPASQVAFLRTLKSAGKPLVVVLTAGCAVSIPEVLELADALLYVWYPGEQGGNAVADVLFGRVNPAGRLPVTIVKDMGQLPPFESYAMQGRTYRFMQEAPLLRFGFGLSYTSFRYGALKLSRKKIGPEESVQVHVDVTNTGKIAGEEVVQVYVRDLESSVPVPRLHLEGFERIALKPHEKKTVSFTLTSESLAAYDDNGVAFVEPGMFEVAVGNCQPVDDAFAGKRAMLEVTR
jgi:beta-glucosidase